MPRRPGHVDLREVIDCCDVLRRADPAGHLQDAERGGNDAHGDAAEDKEGVCHGVYFFRAAAHS